MSKVVNVNTDPKNGFIPEINIWCPQTIVERKAMAKIDATIARYPKIGLRALVASTSEASRLIKQGGIKIDSKKVEDPKMLILAGTKQVYQVGKRKFLKIET